MSGSSHFEPHFNTAGLCVCSCDQCTLRLLGTCVCLDCPCDGMGDRGDEHMLTAEFDIRLSAPPLPRPPLSSLLYWYDIRPELSVYGTPASPVAFLPLGEPERPRLPEGVPPLVSPSWVRLASSLASGAASG